MMGFNPVRLEMPQNPSAISLLANGKPFLLLGISYTSKLKHDDGVRTHEDEISYNSSHSFKSAPAEKAREFLAPVTIITQRSFSLSNHLTAFSVSFLAAVFACHNYSQMTLRLDLVHGRGSEVENNNVRFRKFKDCI